MSVLSRLLWRDERERAWSVDVAMRVQEGGLDLEKVLRDAETVARYYKGNKPTAEMKRVK